MVGWCAATQRAAAGAFVEVDAVVTDRAGQPVHGLRASDFVLKEDGQVAATLIADEIAPKSARREPVTFAVVLDDTSVLPIGTLPMQRLARAFLMPATTADRVAVSSLRPDPAELLFGHLSDALLAIRNYTAHGDVEFDELTVTRWLDRFAGIASQAGEVDGRRKAIVAIGNSILLDPVAPADRWRNNVWRSWLNAAARAAQSNAALYVIDSDGTSGLRPDADFGLAHETGGRRFSTLNVGGAFADIWREMTNYYVLSYVPLTARPMHKIDVSVNRRGLHVQARRIRGE